jgi:hypothetical protein
MDGDKGAESVEVYFPKRNAWTPVGRRIGQHSGNVAARAGTARKTRHFPARRHHIGG